MAAAEAFRVPGQAQKFSLARESFRKKREFCGKRGAAYPLPLYGAKAEPQQKQSRAKAEPNKGGAAAQEEGEEQRTKERNRREMLWNRQYITVEAVKAGQATLRCKSKTRVILIPAGLRKILLKCIRQSGRQSGAVFVTKSGQGVSAQPAPSVRTHILQRRKGHREAGGYAGAQQYQHHPYLHGRKQSPPQGGTEKDGELSLCDIRVIMSLYAAPYKKRRARPPARPPTRRRENSR